MKDNKELVKLGRELAWRIAEHAHNTFPSFTADRFANAYRDLADALEESQSKLTQAKEHEERGIDWVKEHAKVTEKLVNCQRELAQVKAEIPCSACEGSGEVPLFQEDIDGVFKKYKKCEACNGTGLKYWKDLK